MSRLDASPISIRGRSRNATSRPARPDRLRVHRRRSARRSICRRCSTASRTSSTWRRRPACAGAGAREFQVYTGLNIDATQRLLEACVGRPIERLVYASSSSVYGDDVAMPMREDGAAAAGVAVRRDQARGRAALPPLFRQFRRADRVAALLHRLRPAAAARHGLPPLLHARSWTASRWSSSATACRPATSRSWPTPPRPRPTAAVRGVPGRVYNIGGGSRVSLREVFDLIARVSGRHGARSISRARRRATCATPTPTPRGPGPTSASPRRSRSKRACGDVALDGSDDEHDVGFDEWMPDCAGRWRSLAGCAAQDGRRAAGHRRRRQVPVRHAAPRPRKDKKWLDAREYFRNIVDNYPQSPYPPRRQAGARRHLHRRGTHRDRCCWRPTSSASS